MSGKITPWINNVEVLNRETQYYNIEKGKFIERVIIYRNLS